MNPCEFQQCLNHHFKGQIKIKSLQSYEVDREKRTKAIPDLKITCPVTLKRRTSSFFRGIRRVSGALNCDWCVWRKVYATHPFSLSLLFFQIHIIDFDDENNIINKNVLLHQAGEIWHIGASPADKAVLTTCYNKSESYCFLPSLASFSASLGFMFPYSYFYFSVFVSFLHKYFIFLFFPSLFNLMTSCNFVKNHNMSSAFTT